MTEKEFTDQLPPFTANEAAFTPPFLFNGLSARVFPLRANLDALQQLCDGYLNMVPPEVARFRAFLPYAYLWLLNYGEITAASVGWFAQIEVYFLIPVEWYKFVDGQWVFHDWAVITPYIFVDDSFSMPLGRTVYGFPKVLAEVTNASSKWVFDPLASVSLETVSTKVFPRAYSGASLEDRVFMEVERAAPMSNFRLPFDPASPISPWVVASRLADAIGGFGRDALWLAQSMRIFPINPLGSAPLAGEMLSRIAPAFGPGGQGFVQNSINLKQFRRAEDPTRICYQALTNGAMITTAFNGGGLLGEDRTMLGDLSGGYTIKLHEFSSLPIARLLGLEVHRRWSAGEADVLELKPVMPFWMDVDVKYEQGENLAWRTSDGIWKDGGGNPFDPCQKPVPLPESPDFNGTVTSDIEAISGPFEFTGTTIRVLPLTADRKKLQSFLDNFINKPLESPIFREDGRREHVRFSVWARPPQPVNAGGLKIGGETADLYLTASTFGGVTSETNNVGDWAKYELAFLIPVRWERRHEDGSWEIVGVGLVPAASFVDDCVAAISRTEVLGIEEFTANFVRPESVWLGTEEGDPGGAARQTLLRVDAEILPALGQGQKAVIRPVVEISRGDADAGFGEDASRDAPFQWAEALRLEQGTKNSIKVGFPDDLQVARALALELLGNETPVSFYTLKQFRDIVDPNKACYQSIVRVSRTLRDADVRELEQTVVVRLHDYPSINIVETLGIQAERVPHVRRHNDSGIVYTAQAVRPFYICATMDEDLGERLMWRSGAPEWTAYDKAFQTLLSDDPGSPPITADYLAERLQDQMDPSRIPANMFEARQRLPWPPELRAGQNPPAPAIEKADARKALEIVDPQMVIDSVLSREWANLDPGARWRSGREQLLKSLAALPLSGGEAKAYTESVLYRKLNNALASRQGSVASPVPEDLRNDRNEADGPAPNTAAVRWQEQIEPIFESEFNFTLARQQMESAVDVLTVLAVLGWEKTQKVFPGDAQKTILDAADQFMNALEAIAGLQVKGEPSESNNLSTYVLADLNRLKVLLADLKDKLTIDGKFREDALEIAMANLEEFRDVVDLARRFCQAQQEALLNKLSRAYQKPDFCIHRDAVGVNKDQLLPLSLSWDDHWYYGNQIEL